MERRHTCQRLRHFVSKVTYSIDSYGKRKKIFPPIFAYMCIAHCFENLPQLSTVDYNRKIKINMSNTTANPSTNASSATGNPITNSGPKYQTWADFFTSLEAKASNIALPAVMDDIKASGNDTSKLLKIMEAEPFAGLLVKTPGSPNPVLLHNLSSVRGTRYNGIGWGNSTPFALHGLTDDSTAFNVNATNIFSRRGRRGRMHYTAFAQANTPEDIDNIIEPQAAGGPGNDNIDYPTGKIVPQFILERIIKDNAKTSSEMALSALKALKTYPVTRDALQELVDIHRNDRENNGENDNNSTADEENIDPAMSRATKITANEKLLTAHGATILQWLKIFPIAGALGNSDLTPVFDGSPTKIAASKLKRHTHGFVPSRTPPSQNTATPTALQAQDTKPIGLSEATCILIFIIGVIRFSSSVPVLGHNFPAILWRNNS